MGLSHVVHVFLDKNSWLSSYHFTAALWKLQILNFISQSSAKLKDVKDGFAKVLLAFVAKQASLLANHLVK